MGRFVVRKKCQKDIIGPLMIRGMNCNSLDPVTINNLELKDVVLQVWRNPVQQAVKKGYKVIASHAQFWYLDCGHGGWT